MESDQTEYYEVEGINFDGKPKKFLYPKPKKKETEDREGEKTDGLKRDLSRRCL